MKSLNTKAYKKIVVCFAPKFTNTNPYQESLADNLQDLGVESEGIEDYKLYLPKEVEKNKAKLLHLHWLHRFYHRSKDKVSIRVFIKFIIGILVLKLRRIPIVWTAHNIKSHEDTNVILDRLCNILVSKQADAIIAHSKTAKQEIIETYNIRNPDKISVIPHANYVGQYKNEISKQDAKAKLNIPSSKTVFLFFGIIRPYKGIPELIEAFEKLENEGAYLLIAGQSRDEELRKLIESKAAQNKSIHSVPDFISEDDVQLYMNAADVVIFPYRKLLTSGAILLAMSFGKACIAPIRGYITEILDAKGCFLYHPNTEDGLTQAMREAFEKKSDLENMGNHNYNVTKLWGWKEVASETLSIYSKCLDLNKTN